MKIKNDMLEILILNGWESVGNDVFVKEGLRLSFAKNSNLTIFLQFNNSIIKPSLEDFTAFMHLDGSLKCDITQTQVGFGGDATTISTVDGDIVKSMAEEVEKQFKHEKELMNNSEDSWSSVGVDYDKIARLLD